VQVTIDRDKAMREQRWKSVPPRWLGGDSIDHDTRHLELEGATR
jgi:hypothetical protein